MAMAQHVRWHVDAGPTAGMAGVPAVGGSPETLLSQEDVGEAMGWHPKHAGAA